MKKTIATLHILLNAECPYCENYMDLLDISMGLNDEGELIDQAIPGDGSWSASHQNFEEEIQCPECGETFKVEGIDW